MRTMTTPPRSARDSSRACQRAGLASRRTWQGRYFSSPPKLRISIPATSFMPTAAIPPDSRMLHLCPRHGDLGEDESAVARVGPCVDLGEAVRGVDYVVEAVFEDLALKQKLFAEIETDVRPDTILASNTSVIPITSIMAGLKRRERALGTHWWNPPFLVPLVEVIETRWTSPGAVAWTMDLHRAAGKQPAHVKKDVP